ncbi:hypothetical protein [Luteolibacter sp. LG18]|uniref:hypothetical protein n=1 Tax=Luteolibacter sp. LG18 TaxID=2819286 RepID=UPI002B2CAEDE|nr:hypothetical protein llg_29540 [Luteolibacter sp. LG18]
MATFQHPSALNPLQRYSQACSVLRSTSRARNEAWYQDALDLDFQLHLRAEGSGVLSRAYNRKTGEWLPGPDLDDETLRNPEKAAVFASEVIAFTRKAGASSVGVVLHVADEFATTELKPTFDNPGALNDLRAAAENDPASILDDTSIPSDQNSWRVLPYPAAGSETIATVISLTRLYGPFLDQLRMAGEVANFPVVTRAVSAPLVALLAIPRVIRPSEGRPYMAVLHYSNFTVLAFFNEHSDLQLLRTLQHRGQRRPSNLRHAASTTTAALELIDPEVYVLNLSPQAEPGLTADLRVVFPSSLVEEVDWAVTPLTHAALPVHTPELLVSLAPPLNPEEAPLSHTFTVFQNEQWVFQNFLPTPRDIAEIYPSRSEMRLLRAIRMIRLGIAACAVLALTWALLEAFTVIRRPEWGFDPKSAQAVQQRLAGLNAERQRVNHWDNLLDDRSKAWTSMELLCRLFPERGGFLIKGFSHNVKTELAPGQPKAGFVKEWKITGFARDEALDRLNLINSREGISAIFSELARITQNPAFRTDIGNRSIVPNVRTQENSAFKPRPADEIQDDDPNTYPLTFDLTITQRFESADPMAISVAKVP